MTLSLTRLCPHSEPFSPCQLHRTITRVSRYWQPGPGQLYESKSKLNLMVCLCPSLPVDLTQPSSTCLLFSRYLLFQVLCNPSFSRLGLSDSPFPFGYYATLFSSFWVLCNPFSSFWVLCNPYFILSTTQLIFLLIGYYATYVICLVLCNPYPLFRIYATLAIVYCLIYLLFPVPCTLLFQALCHFL